MRETAEIAAEKDRPVKHRRVSQREAQIDERVAPITPEHQRQAHEQQVQPEKRPEDPSVDEHRHIVAFRSLGRRVREALDQVERGRELIPVGLARHCLERQARFQEVMAPAQFDLAIQDVVDPQHLGNGTQREWRKRREIGDLGMGPEAIF